jgi:hypothetical protein
VEEAVLEMYLQGVSTRKVAAITEGLSRVRIGKDAVSRVAQRLEEELSAWRGRPLELAYPYLYLDAAYFKVNWGGRVVDLALLVAVGVNEEGYREVLAVEPAGGERKEAWRNLLKGLVERGLRGVRLVISEVRTYRVWAIPLLAGRDGGAFPGCQLAAVRACTGCGTWCAHGPQAERKVHGELRPHEPGARRWRMARRLGELLLSRWEVENRSFWVRDVLLREDACQVRGVGAQVLAALRAFLVSLLHRQGVREKKAALEAFSFNPLAALRFLGLYAV